MPRHASRKAHPWLLYLASIAAVLLAAELIVVETFGSGWVGRPSTIAGWAFEVVVAALLVGVGRSETANRRKSARLVTSLDESLASIRTLTEASLSSLRLEELLHELLGRLREVLGVDLVTVLVVGEDGQLRERATEGAGDFDNERVVSMTGGIVGRAIEAHTALATTDPWLLSELNHRFLLPIGGAAACPIFVEGRLMGVCVAITSSDERLDDRDFHLLQVVADRAGTGIERTRLDEAERRSRLELERARQHVSVLADASEALSIAKDEYEGVLAHLVDVAVPRFSNWCAIDLLAPNGSLHRIAARHGSDRSGEAALELDLRAPQLRAMARRVLAPDGPEVLTDPPVLARSLVEVNEANRPNPTTSSIVAAIRVNSYPLGAISFVGDRGRAPFDSIDVDTALDLARRAAVTVERVLLYTDARSAAERSERIAGQLHQLIATSLDGSLLRSARDVLVNLANRAQMVFDADLVVISARRGDGTPIRSLAGKGSEDLIKRADAVLDAEGAAALETGTLSDPRTWMSAPIGGRDGTRIGTVAIHRELSVPATEEDLAVLVLLAQMTASAIESADLYETIQASEGRWRALVEAAPIGILEVDLNRATRWWNHAAAMLFSWPDIEESGGEEPLLAGPTISSLEPILAESSGGTLVLGRELSGVPIGGTERDLSVSGAPLVGADGNISGILVMVDDVTNRMRLEENLRQAQRMEAVGQLAGSVAHDFNNLLTLISGYSELLRHELGDRPRANELIENVATVTDRATLLTGQLLAISRRQQSHPVVLSPVATVEAIVDVLGRVVGEEVVLHCDFAVDVADVKVDPDGFQQILVNLAINARDAMPTGGKLTISVDNVLVEDELKFAVPSGRYVRITVADTGTGMDEETLARCFEPFYTTKAAFHGTGLGLPAVRDVVTKSHGDIRVESDPGHGTRFEIVFPISEEAAAEVEATVPATTREVETVLVADDDAEIRELVRRVLAHGGYRVLTASTGEAALWAAEGASHPIDLLVTDVAMPGMNGPELVRTLHERMAGIPVLFISGSTLGIELPNLVPGSVSYLAKPFAPSELLQTVRSLLNTESAADSARW